jgi:hypothetical protein
MNKIGLTVADVVSGNFVPHTGLEISNFEFVLASDDVTTVTFTGFAEIGNGNYVFYGFDVPTVNGTTHLAPYLEVKVKIGGTIQNGYGIITIYHDNDEPVSQSYTDMRADRNGDTMFGWLTQDNVNWRGATALTSPADYNLVHKKWVADNYATIAAINSTFPLDSNRIVVDSKATVNITGKVYQTISGAIDYAHTYGSPSITNRWQIIVLPSHTGQYIENFYWYDFIDIIGLGWVKVTNTAGYSLFIRSGSFTDYNCRAVNLQFEQTDENLEFKLMLMHNCSAVMIEDSYSPVLSLNQSQYVNCNFSGIGGYSVITGKGNHVFNCTGGYNVAWDGSDKTYNWAYISGDYIHQ